MLKHLVFMTIAACTLTNLQAKPKESTRTKSGLKEDIGLQLKASIDECVNIQQRLAEVGAQTCQVQRKLMEHMEELLENGPLFKGQNKTDLEQKLTTLIQSTNELSSCAHCIDPKPTTHVLASLNQASVQTSQAT